MTPTASESGKLRLTFILIFCIFFRVMEVTKNEIQKRLGHNNQRHLIFLQIKRSLKVWEEPSNLQLNTVM